jgi:hypothetical protein
MPRGLGLATATTSAAFVLHFEDCGLFSLRYKSAGDLGHADERTTAFAFLCQ